MTDLKICRICLRTEAKMYKYERFHMKSYYEEVLALKVNDEEGLPPYFCFECAMLLHKFHKFKEKCYRGQKVLKELLWCGPLSYEAIYKIDRASKQLQSELALITNSNRVNCYVIVDNRENGVNELEKEYKGEEMMKEDCDKYHDSNESLENDINEMQSQKIIFNDIEKNRINFENESIMRRKNSISGDESNFKAQLFDASKWKIINLSEEEAIKEFRLRAEDQKYLAATYKCGDCFRSFSKESMLRCHIQLKHRESLGFSECHFCKVRFRWHSHLKRHIRQHYIKYQCLRCDRICPLENTAVRHEEYHSGVTKECTHCGKKFRHSSTYYTHLRTHRSHFVCTICGSSFVSEVGLRQHKRVKHAHEDIESPDDDEEVNTYCDKCNINFETRKAYEEHLFHSAMHSEVVDREKEENEENDKSASRKVLGKKVKTLITKRLRRQNPSDEAISSMESKRRRRQKRRYCKPTTCHQCGKHFATQSACKKHHHTEHPRTSFFPPTARHICEICGASLAPGSVATHQNMHTRSKVHPCEICGRQFHATVGLKRHLLTHTGEKPFACTLCDKRFTQSNSMKLHYRTFHLKQPYPKRSRSKKGKGEDESDSTEDDSEDERKKEMDIARDMNISKATNLQEIENNVIVDDNMHYLTLT